MRFFIPMEPPRTTAQTARLGVTKTGKPYQYKPRELAEAQAKIQAALAPHRPHKPTEGPIRLTVKWCFEGKVEAWKTTRPDTDNLQKAIKDIMTKLGFWLDDAQVCSEIIEKFYSPTPGIFVQIEQL